MRDDLSKQTLPQSRREYWKDRFHCTLYGQKPLVYVCEDTWLEQIVFPLIKSACVCVYVGDLLSHLGKHLCLYANSLVVVVVQ